MPLYRVGPDGLNLQMGGREFVYPPGVLVWFDAVRDDIIGNLMLYDGLAETTAVHVAEALDREQQFLPPMPASNSSPEIEGVPEPTSAGKRGR